MNRLREWREANDLSLRDVEDLTGFSYSHLSRMERGERRVPPLTKVLVARRLGARIADLFPPEPVPAWADDEVAA